MLTNTQLYTEFESWEGLEAEEMEQNLVEDVLARHWTALTF